MALKSRYLPGEKQFEGLQPDPSSLTLRAERHRQVLENVHEGGVRDGVHGNALVLLVDRVDGTNTHVHDDGTDHADIVALAGRLGGLEEGGQVGEEADGGSCLEVVVQPLPQLVRNDGVDLAMSLRVDRHLRQTLNLNTANYLVAAPISPQMYLGQILRERIGKSHVPGVGAEDEIAKLDTIRWDRVAEHIMVVAEDFCHLEMDPNPLERRRKPGKSCKMTSRTRKVPL
jgi:hypothetical protein